MDPSTHPPFPAPAAAAITLSNSTHWHLLLDIFPLFSSPIPWLSASPIAAEEIAVREAGALLRVHVGEILLHIRPHDSLSEKAEHELEGLLDLLFATLEPLVGDCVPDPVIPPNVRDRGYMSDTVAKMYPGLVKLGSLLLTRPPVECHRFLVLRQRAVPFKSTRYRVEQFLKNVRKIFECASPTESGGNKQAHSLIRSRFSETFWKCSMSLFSTLEHHLKGCARDPTHNALLHLMAFPHPDDEREPKMHTSLSACPHQKNLQWQEVLFTVTNPDITTSVTTTSPSNEDLISDICEVARQAYECRQAVNIYVCNERLYESQCDDIPSNREDEATIPLSSLFDDNVLQDRNRFPPVHKRILALTLAQSLLHLYGGPWIQTDWSAENVLFMYGKDSNRVYDIHQPYLSCALTPETTFRTEIDEPMHKHPLVLSFGRLLMELDKGERIPVTETLRSGKPSLYRTLKSVFDDWRMEQLTCNYVAAIDGCLKFSKWLQEHRGVSPEVACRRVIMDRIVRPLELEVGTFPGTEVGTRHLDFSPGFPGSSAAPCRVRVSHVDRASLARPLPVGRVIAPPISTTDAAWKRLAGPKMSSPRASSIPQIKRLKPPPRAAAGITPTATSFATSTPSRQGERPRVEVLPNAVQKSYVSPTQLPQVPEVRSSTDQTEQPPSKGIVVFSDCDEPQPEDKQRWAKDFMEKLEDFRSKCIHRCKTAPRVKIAVLDTGLSNSDIRIQALRQAARLARREDSGRGTYDAIKGLRNFTNGPDKDEDGHGSHVVSLLLTVAPHADLYVGKISRRQQVGMGEQKISEALRWAVDEVQADIISMSFGFDDDSDWDEAMDRAIVRCYAAGRIVFAAACNYGGNSERTYPAKAETVFCMHAADGNGNQSGGDPTAVKNNVNFSTLGVAVPCGTSDGKDVFKTGTSYSTPIAAGIAANIMDLGDWLHMNGRFTAEQRRRLRSFAGMKSVFKLMAPEPRQGYDYVAPWNLWNGRTSEEVVWEKIKEKL